jgi:molecular chaperone DnaK (HSP70)
MSLLNAERDQSWIGCVDFGTALSKMVMVRAIPRNELEREDVKPLAIAVRDGFAPRNPFLLPSIVFVSNDHLMFGQEAEQIAIAAELSGRHAFVSPKQYLSTHDPEDIDQPLPRDIDPSGRFTARSLLTMFLAHLLERAGHNAAREGVPWPVALRVARPAWDSERAAIGETTLQSLVRDGFALIDSLGESLSARGGVSHSAALAALEKLQRSPATDSEHLFSFSSNGSASILEATAVAAGSIRATGRRVVAIADIGGGTSDFGAFMTGLAGFDVLAEIQGSSKILKEAGDYLDMHLRRHILAAAGLLHDDPAARGAVNRLRARARANKEILFTEGRLTVEVGDDFVEVALADFLADQHVQAFSQRLRDRFHETLRIAVACARAYPQPNPRRTRTRVEIMLTGGGHALPMARALVEEPSVKWTYAEQAPDLVEAPEDADFNIVRRQLAVAIGGAVLDLPMEVPPLRLED